MKTCQEIEIAINEIKQNFKKKKSPASDKKRCKSENPDFKCKECNCWKLTREICS
jgi:hypothetical protein